MMKQMAAVFVLGGLRLAVVDAFAENVPATRAVAFVNSEIVLDPTSTNRRALTSDGVAKQWPLWSKRGTRIAFLKQVPESVALDRVVVIDTSGKQVAAFDVEPVVHGLGYTGMRAVESMQWLDEDTIVVGGSINPSQSQYYVFHVGSSEVRDFVDDLSAPAISLDGRSLVATRGVPHWKNTGDRESAVTETRPSAAKVPLPPQDKAIALRRTMRKGLLSKNAIGDADFWCADCPLADLPRRVSNAD
jgi:hypothetical protein